MYLLLDFKTVIGVLTLVITANCHLAGLAHADDDARELLVAMLAGRSNLVSGHCKITGISQGEPGVERQSGQELDLKFDFSKNAFRLADIPRRGAFLATPDFRYTISYRDALDRFSPVRRYALGDLPASGVPGFDIRTLGFYVEPDSHILEERCLDFEAMREFFLDSDQVEAEADGALRRLSFRLPLKEGGHYRQHFRVWLDPSQGYTTTRIEEVSANNNFATLFYSDIDWERRGDAWVMTAFRQGEDGSSTIDWHFDWRSVNEEIPDYDLSVNSLIPDGKKTSIYVVPFPSNRPVDVGMVDNREKTAGEGLPKVASSAFSWSGLMVFAGGFLMLIAILFFSLGRKKAADA